MSAIPWVGTDIVEFINNYILSTLPLTTINLTKGKLKSLPKIGNFNIKSRANRSKWLTEAEYLSIPKSFLAFLVGFIDGDGYIQIRKSAKGYVNFNLTISIHLNDIAVLNYIYSILKIGTIYTYFDRRSPTCRLVFNKTELQEILFPLLMYHRIFFLTENRRSQFNIAMHILTDIKLYSCLPKCPPIIFDLPLNAKGYVYLPFFKNWIVGFVGAEGSFFVKANNDSCFQIKQKLHHTLFEAFKIVFDTNRKIYIDKDIYLQFGVSSKSDIQKVINFFSFSGLHPLVGLKNIQYSIWLDALRNSSRYKDLNFPD